MGGDRKCQAEVRREGGGEKGREVGKRERDGPPKRVMEGRGRVAIIVLLSGLERV